MIMKGSFVLVTWGTLMKIWYAVISVSNIKANLKIFFQLLYFDGRMKELIKYKNCHLSPVEIEDIIIQHPGVLEVGVFGRSWNGKELVTAVVAKKEGFEDLNEKEIANFVDERVDDFKRLRGGVIFVDRLPRNPIGKLVRKELLNLPQIKNHGN